MIVLSDSVDGHTDRQIFSGYYSGRHCEQCGRAVKKQLSVLLVHFQFQIFHSFLPRCMKCRCGLAMRILSVRLSVCLSVCQTHDL